MTPRSQLARATALAASLLAAGPPSSSAAAAAGARFQTASVRRHAPEDGGASAIRLQPGGGFVATNVTLRELVGFAWQRHPFDRREVLGGPDWVDSERFDVTARASAEHVLEPDGSVPQTWAMLKVLLGDRFRLQARERSEERPVYALRAAGTAGPGPGLRRTDVDCRAAMTAPPAAVPAGQGPPCSTKTPPGRLFARTMTMATIASLLSPHLDRVVVDRTGLSGRFDVELEAAEIKAAADYRPGPSDLGLPPPAGTPIRVAVREQLGLALEPEVAPVALVVIDRAERPSPE